MSTKEEIPKKLLNIMFGIKEKLDDECIAEIKEYIDYREWGLAYETLCVVIKDYKIKITPNMYNELKKIGDKMQIKPIFIELIKDFVLK